MGAVLLLSLVLGMACRSPQPVVAPTPPVPDPTPAPNTPEPVTEAPPLGDREPAVQSDVELQDRVHLALAGTPELEGAEITVRAEHGTVRLGGFVRSEQQKQRAHEVAHAVDGVVRVMFDELEVRRP